MKAQELIIGHLLPIAVTIAVLWVVYRLLFRNSNRLYFNRYFLLTSMLLALAMPLLGLLSGLEVPQMATLKQSLFNGTLLNEIVVTPDTAHVARSDGNDQHAVAFQRVAGHRRHIFNRCGCDDLVVPLQVGETHGAHHPFAEAQDERLHGGLHRS
jgi:hypothetical protein